MSTSRSGLIYAFVLDGRGGARAIDWDQVAAWRPEDGALWLHLDYTADDATRWLAERSRIDDVMRDGLLDHDPRPRAVAHGDDLLLIVRGINLNQGAAPEDMISVRTWVERDRVITVRHRVSRSIKAIAADLEAGRGPRGAAELAVALCERIVDGVVTRVDRLSDAIAALEDQVLAEANPSDLRARLADHRRRAIALRRFLGPQRDALAKLGQIAVPHLTADQRERITEVADRMARTLEELEAARDRAAVTQEELSSRVAELANQRLYVLSLITAVFLPLGFVCALLGVNVGGIPFREDDWAFWALCGAFAAGVAVQLWWFKRRGWM